MRKPDYAHKLTDEQISELEQRIAKNTSKRRTNLTAALVNQ